MRPLVGDIRLFYASPAGKVVCASICKVLSACLVDAPARGASGLLGYASPYLGAMERCCGNLFRLIPMMPATQGAEAGSCLVHEESLPLADSSCHFMLLVHCLEFAEDVEAVLSEVWRVLVDRGQVLLIVPNAYGLWAYFEGTPFAKGRAFSKSSLQKDLEKTHFTVQTLTNILPIPLPQWERMFRILFGESPQTLSSFPGLLAVCATKLRWGEIWSPLPTEERVWSPA